MTVNELIHVLQTMPPGAQIRVMDGGQYVAPQPEQEWNDHAENYIVVL